MHCELKHEFTSDDYMCNSTGQTHMSDEWMPSQGPVSMQNTLNGQDGRYAETPSLVGSYFHIQTARATYGLNVSCLMAWQGMWCFLIRWGGHLRQTESQICVSSTEKSSYTEKLFSSTTVLLGLFCLPCHYSTGRPISGFPYQGCRGNSQQFYDGMYWEKWLPHKDHHSFNFLHFSL